jgi:hypothetical protein
MEQILENTTSVILNGETCYPKVCYDPRDGYYVGTERYDSRIGDWMPHRRLSDYNRNRERVELMLINFYKYYES